MLGLQSRRIDIDERSDNKVARIVGLHRAWVPNVVHPSFLELQKRFRSLRQQRFEGLDISANADAFDTEAHIFKVFGKSAFATEMDREVSDQDGSCRDRMYEFQREQLTGADELMVVLVNEKEGKNGEQVGEQELQGNDGCRICEKIQPISAWRRRRIAVISVVERSYPAWVIFAIVTVTANPEIVLSLP